MITQQLSQELGRAAQVARLTQGLPLDPDPFPPLLDVQLLWMAPGGLVLSGIELVNGVAYGQSWWCRSE